MPPVEDSHIEDICQSCASDGYVPEHRSKLIVVYLQPGSLNKLVTSAHGYLGLVRAAKRYSNNRKVIHFT